MLFGNMLNLVRDIFLPLEERPVSSRPLSLYASEMLAMQKNLLEKSAAELLRSDLLHMSTKEFSTHKDYPPGSFVLVHYRTGAPPSRLQCVALMGNGIKSLFPPKYHRVRISATRTYAFGTFLHQHF